MKSTRPPVYPQSVGNVALADVVEEQPAWGESAIDDPSDPSRDNLSTATGILVGIALSALLWGGMALLLYVI